MEDCFIRVLETLIKRQNYKHVTYEPRGTEDLLPRFWNIPLKATREESEKNCLALMSSVQVPQISLVKASKNG